MTVDPQAIRAERHLKIGTVIQRGAGAIIERWRHRAVEEQPQARRVHEDALLDHLPALLKEIGRSLSASEPDRTLAHKAPAREHGTQRWQAGWSVAEVVRDYQILRLVLLDYLEDAMARPLTGREVMAIGLVLDEAIAASVKAYVTYREESALREEREQAERSRAADAKILRHQAEAWREASRRKDEFLAVLGHELRNPLAPIRNALQILHLKGDDAKTRSWVEEIFDRQLTLMTRLIDELLDASRIGRGKVLLEKRRLDLAAAVSTVAEDYRGAAEAAGLTLDVRTPDGPVWVEGDPTRLTQIVGNLLHNACKFTDPGGRVYLELETEGNPGRAVLRVRDTGIGIEPAALPYVFDAFSQAEESIARSRGGLGLGLALVKGLVELHGGAVAAESAGPGCGAEFSFWVPLIEAKRRGPERRSRPRK